MLKSLNEAEKEELVETVSRALGTNGPKKPRNLMLKVETWLAFEKLCEKDGVWPSEVLDEFIAKYLVMRAKKET